MFSVYGITGQIFRGLLEEMNCSVGLGTRQALKYHLCGTGDSEGDILGLTLMKVMFGLLQQCKKINININCDK